jgi:hypothetical protein
VGPRSASRSYIADPLSRADVHPPSSWRDRCHMLPCATRAIYRVAVTRLRLQRRPHEARQFARDGDDSFVRGFAFREASMESSTQPVLGLVGDCDHTWGLALSTGGQSSADAGPILIVPTLIDHHAAHEPVRRLDDPRPPVAVGTRVFARDQAEIGVSARRLAIIGGRASRPVPKSPSRWSIHEGMELRELARVTPVGLHAVPSFPWRRRGCNHHTTDPTRRQLPLQRVDARHCFGTHTRTGPDARARACDGGTRSRSAHSRQSMSPATPARPTSPRASRACAHRC